MLHYPDVHLTGITLTSTDILKPYLDYLDINFNFKAFLILIPIPNIKPNLQCSDIHLKF